MVRFGRRWKARAIDQKDADRQPIASGGTVRHRAIPPLNFTKLCQCPAYER